VAALVGASSAAALGRAVGSGLSSRGVGTSLGESLLVGVVIGAGALAVMVGLALAVDPSIIGRVRRARHATRLVEEGGA
jgi:putative peptidoglycan lipid II flippase